MMYRVMERGGRVRVLLAGSSDVPLAQRAAEFLYARLMRRRVQLFEYQPQILHAKLLVMDDTVLSAAATWIAAACTSISNCCCAWSGRSWPPTRGSGTSRRWRIRRRCSSRAVAGSRSVGRRLWSWFAYLLLSRVDPLIARRRFRADFLKKSCLPMALVADDRAVHQRRWCGRRLADSRGSCVTTSTAQPNSRLKRRNSSNTPAAVLRVQVAGGFVRQQQRRPRDQRAGNGHALLLATGQFAAACGPRSRARPTSLEQRSRALDGLRPRAARAPPAAASSRSRAR